MTMSTQSPVRSTEGTSSEMDARSVVRRLVEEVQSGGDYAVFDELIDPAFVDHTPFPGYSPDKDGARRIYQTFRTGFPDFRATVHFQVVEGDRVASFKTYQGTHLGEFAGLAPTGRQVSFAIMDVYRVQNGRVTDHWGVPHVWQLMQQLGVAPSADVATGVAS